MEIHDAVITGDGDLDSSGVLKEKKMSPKQRREKRHFILQFFQSCGGRSTQESSSTYSRSRSLLPPVSPAATTAVEGVLLAWVFFASLGSAFSVFWPSWVTIAPLLTVPSWFCCRARTWVVARSVPISCCCNCPCPSNPFSSWSGQRQCEGKGENKDDIHDPLPSPKATVAHLKLAVAQGWQGCQG